MIIDDYAYIKYIKNIGGYEREETIKLKHIKSLEIKEGFIIIRAMREDVYYTEVEYRDNEENIRITKSYQKKQSSKNWNLKKEEEIFKNWRFDIREIKELKL